MAGKKEKVARIIGVIREKKCVSAFEIGKEVGLGVRSVAMFVRPYTKQGVVHCERMNNITHYSLA
jgi:predicted transcriptional regulator